MKVGTRVRLSGQYKAFLREHGSRDHVKEFGDEIGVVVKKKADIEHWPEVQVEWGDTGLRYLYAIDQLEVVL